MRLYLLLLAFVNADLFRRTTSVQSSSPSESYLLSCPGYYVLLSCTCVSESVCQVYPDTSDNICTASGVPVGMDFALTIVCSDAPDVYAIQQVGDVTHPASCPANFSLTGCSVQSSPGTHRPLGVTMVGQSCVLHNNASNGETAEVFGLCANGIPNSTIAFKQHCFSSSETGLVEFVLDCGPKAFVVDCQCDDSNGSCFVQNISESQCTVAASLAVPDVGCSRIVTAVCFTPPAPAVCTVPTYFPGFYVNGNCSATLVETSHCSLECMPGFIQSNDSVRILECAARGLVFPPTYSCLLPGSPATQVLLSFVLQLDGRLCGLNISDPATVSNIVRTFVENAEAVLGFDANTIVPQKMTGGGNAINMTLLFTTLNKLDVDVSDYLLPYLEAVHQPVSEVNNFNVTTPDGSVCGIHGVVLHLEIFPLVSLFALLSEVSPYLLYTMLVLLIIVVIALLVMNRKSHHPFALVGAFLSIINFAGKIVFVQFLSVTYETLDDQRIQNSLYQYFAAGVSCLCLSVFFNYGITLLLLRFHAGKNAHAFSEWLARHRVGILIILISCCGLNPASALVLCSGSFGLELFDGPISWQAQSHFQGAGLVSVLLTDFPFIVLQILTLQQVGDNSQLSFGGSQDAVIFPLVVSGSSLLMGIFRRVFGAFFANSVKEKKAQAKETATNSTENALAL